MVSVCIRAYERRGELITAVESALAQTYRGELEVVVSDDSGRLGDTVTARFGGDPRVRYVANPAPSGPAGNLRHAVSHAGGDLLAMLNDDDWWEPRFLETCVRVLERDPGIDVVFTDQVLDVGGGRVRHTFPSAPGRHDRFLREVLIDGLPASATVMRRSAWDDGERRWPLVDRTVGDFAMCIRAARGGHAFYYVPEPLSVTRIHARQGSWSDAHLPDRMIATLAAHRFDDDPESEALRRARLAEQHLIRAGRLLRGGDARRALADVRRARAVGRPLSPARALLALSGVRELLLRWGSSHPRLVAVVFELWPRLRPPVRRRRRQA